MIGDMEAAMDYKKFSKKELSDILDLINAAVTSKTEQDIIRFTTGLKDLVGADHAVCGLGEITSRQLSRILKIVNLDYPMEWLRIYAAEELYKNDPIIKYNYEFSKTHLWSEAMAVYKDEPFVDFMNKASEFGLRYGVASGISEEGSKRGSIFSFSGNSNRFSEHQKDILDIITPHVHQALVRVCGIEDRRDFSLSSREKEVLNWIKEGKTNWEIAIILNISERTVKFHVQNIERKLNAVNKSHAIAIAMDSGLIA